MPGQGRPNRHRRLCRLWHHVRLLGAFWRIVALLCAVIAPREICAAEPMDVRVRIAWGGGDARPWQGTIRISEGTLSDVTPLGLEPDAPGSMRLADSATVRIYPRTPRSYDGCALRVQAPPDAKLLVELYTDQVPSAAPLQLPLAQVIREFTQFDLDDHMNRLLAQRAPGDGLRVSFSRPSLVFSAGERFELQVEPQHLNLAANSKY